MKTEWKLFGLISVFLFVVAAVYGFWSRSYEGHLEWIGVVALILSGLLCLMCTGYFWFVSRRIDLRPEDREDAEISDGAGEVGFFSPGSYWPFGLALAAMIAGVGLVYWQLWLVGAGLAAVLVATGGFLFEYYTGARRAAE
ncbi:cytochrome c oxidase subunit 4 [Rugosimonospora acidiphila]|uniref:Cytochrome c oxidase polypeptide 4 n=1 Tax=Rugosimonospora acidiphila TaxID=556531 RepID=A0ABP9RQ00_9ACTN